MTMGVADINELRDTQLHEAVRFGDLEETREALCHGLDANELGAYQWSPLHEASSNGDIKIVELLLRHKGDPNKKDVLRGCTAVHYAACHGFEDCLQLLIKDGGRSDILNNDGQSCLDIAVGECRVLLQELRDKEIRLTGYDDKESVPDGRVDIQRHKSRSSVGDSHKDDVSERDSALDMDEISVSSESSGSSKLYSRSWGPENVVGLKKDPSLGHIQLSFEYNSKKSTLKIRVWQIYDLLLPPPESSMISTIYVKGYLQPTAKKDTKRKTEELHVDTGKENMKTVASGSTIFKPACFHYAKPLEYERISKSSVKGKTIELAVCIRQKYTHKSFAIATWSMPLEAAIRHIVKVKYPLSRCKQLQMPENMTVYDASGLGLTASRSFSSNPNLKRNPSTNSWAIPYAERASSESDLNKVVVEAGGKKVPSIEITVPEAEDEELQQALQQIAVMELSERATGFSSRSTSIEMESLGSDAELTNSLPGSPDELPDGCGFRLPVKTTSVEIHVPEQQHQMETRTASAKVHESSRKKETSFEGAKGKDVKPKSLVVTKTKVKSVNNNNVGDIDVEVGNILRLETHETWDYSDEPLPAKQVLDVEKGFRDLRFDASEPPMAGLMDIPAIHQPIPRVESGTQGKLFELKNLKSDVRKQRMKTGTSARTKHTSESETISETKLSLSPARERKTDKNQNLKSGGKTQRPVDVKKINSKDLKGEVYEVTL